MNERKDIDHPVWRKKVDAGFLNDSVTPIPKWLWDVWDIQKLFVKVKTKRSPESKVTVFFENRCFEGFVTTSNLSNNRSLCRLNFDKQLHSILKERFLMSYMRSLEGQLLKSKGYTGDVELDIPFWEFIDIEFDKDTKSFFFTAHYSQKPIFPELFKRLVASPAIKKVHDEISSKDNLRIQKQDWRPREQYKTEIGAENVIYTLIDFKNKLLYIGEADKLIPRLDNGHPEIKAWDYYKYNVLPDSLAKYRLAIERMTIRDAASMMNNKQGIQSMNISDFILANKKIDR